jgi:hypothetical protein
MLYHTSKTGKKIAEVEPDADFITDPVDILDLLAEANMNECEKMVIHSVILHPDFFDLSTRLAGEMLQKFSNYRMKLAIVGDFSVYTSKSLRDFIRESNRLGVITFVATLGEALQ